MKQILSLVAAALMSLCAMAQGDYPLNFDPSTLMVRNGDRAISAVTFTSADNSATVSGWSTAVPFPVYADATAQKMTFKPGDVIKPTVNAKSTGWMLAYIYIDYDKNGQFDYEDGELVTQTTNQENYSPIPSFTLPADLADGDYRVRFKTDWKCEDPGGRYGSAYDKDFIDDNRGQIIDFTLHIDRAFTAFKVIEKTTLCNLYLPDGTTQLPSTVTAGDLTFKLVPMDGYVLDGALQIKVGDNVTLISADEMPADGIVTIGDIDGDVTITAACEQGPEATWRCIFHDEFNEEIIGWDDDKWGTRPLVSTVTWARFNSQRKEDGVCIQHDGHMSLMAKPTSSSTMLTGNLTSQEKFDFTYGRAEARLLVHPHKGNFPAFWMIPSAEKPNYSGDGGTWGSWPNSGEIDIMEQIDTENRAYHTIHSHYANSNKGGLGQSYQKTANEYVDMNGKWHIYALEWDEEQLRWYVDGKQVHRYDRIAAKDNDSDRQWPFDRPFYILVNQSVGDGSWASTPDFSHEYCMDVDYVRVYQRTATGGNDNGNGSATALTHVWDTSQLVDGTQIVLEAREQRFGDTSINAKAKGPEYFDGASAKSPSFDSNKHVWVLEAAEAPSGKTGTWFYLKRAGDNGNYVARNGAAITETQNQANAEKFNIVNITANDLANNSYFISGTEITQTLRFIASDGTNFINAGNPQEAAKYASGKGGLSVWYVYLYSDGVTPTAIETANADAMREGVVYNLNGQRVMNSAGVVIVNGKKIMIHN